MSSEHSSCGTNHALQIVHRNNLARGRNVGLQGHQRYISSILRSIVTNNDHEALRCSCGLEANHSSVVNYEDGFMTLCVPYIVHYSLYLGKEGKSCHALRVSQLRTAKDHCHHVTDESHRLVGCNFGTGFQLHTGPCICAFCHRICRCRSFCLPGGRPTLATLLRLALFAVGQVTQESAPVPNP